MSDRFHHPYYFVPTPNRPQTGPLKDEDPRLLRGYHRLGDDLWTGRLTVEMTTVTPLLIPDIPPTTDAVEKGLKSKKKEIPLRLNENGEPVLSVTAARGALSSAYEMITNSRYRVFDGHDTPLGRRMDTSEGRGSVPARVRRLERDGEGKVTELEVDLLFGTSTPGANGPRKGEPLFAAWVSRDKMLKGFEHGDPVWALLRLYERRRIRSRFWGVDDIQKRDPSEVDPHQAGLTPPDEEPSKGRPDDSGADLIGESRPMWVAGWLCTTGKNALNKHDERVFFLGGSEEPGVISDPNGLVDRWWLLIEDAQRVNRSQISEGGPGAGLGRVQWSRHIATRQGSDWKPSTAVATLRQGDLSYAAVTKTSEGFRVDDLYPVMISRRLFGRSPMDLLDESLKPAATYDHLSPADRLFGWVNRKGQGAWKGLLRIGRIEFTGSKKKDVRQFGTPVPLATLASPKPNQGLFYLANSDDSGFGSGQDAATTGYDAKGNRLRGRKVYPQQHHDLTHWEPFAEGNVDTSKAYVHPGGVPDTDYRPIGGWVAPGARFRFVVDVTNLTDAELGALLWLLRLPEGHAIGLGGGKPLGFGAVRLSLESSQLAKGVAWRDRYRGGLEAQLEVAQEEVGLADLVECFEEAVREACEIEDVVDAPFIAAFLRATQGFEGPIHYPLAKNQQGPPFERGEHFRWFVANERGARMPLPGLLDDDPTLQYLGGGTGTPGRGSRREQSSRKPRNDRGSRSRGDEEKSRPSNTLYVGNLLFEATEDDVRGLFAQQGEVQQVKIIRDRDTGRSRGFCFVEMGSIEEATVARTAINRTSFQGRELTVNFARPRR